MTARDGCQRFGQPIVGVDGVQLTSLDQRSDGGPVFGTGIMSGEECVFPVQGNRADGPLDGVAVQFDPSIDQEQAESALSSAP